MGRQNESMLARLVGMAWLLVLMSVVIGLVLHYLLPVIHALNTVGQ